MLTLDGRLNAEAAVELKRVVADLTGPVRLELGGLRTADEVGLETLRALRARGIAFAGASPYLRLLLGPERERKPRGPPSRSKRSGGKQGRSRDRGRP